MSVLRYFHPVLPSKSLKRAPVAIQVAEEKIVLFRSKDREVVALRDRCPHRFTPLSVGRVTAEGKLACPYHGWAFDSRGEGVKPGQAEERPSCRVRSYRAVEKHGYIWVAEKSADAGSIPELEGDGWVLIDSYPIVFEAPLELALDNFSEDEHFPFVHTMFGWNESQVREVEFSCRRVGDEVHVHYWGPQRSFPGMSFFLLKPGQYLNNEWVQRYDPVRVTYTTRITDRAKATSSPTQNRIAIYFVPSGESRTTLHVFQAVKFSRPVWYWFLPMMRRAIVAVAKADFRNDQVFVEKLRGVPRGLEGMMLGEYDEPLKHNRELLESVYFGRPRTVTPRSGEVRGGHEIQATPGIAWSDSTSSDPALGRD